MRWSCLFAVLCIAPCWAQQATPAETTSDSPTNESASISEEVRAAAVDKWEAEIKKLEARDQCEVDPDDAILFVGSSSIRRWDDIEVDMAPYRTIQRGYGGSKYSDVAVFAKRLLNPHQYRALVMFVGNDVKGKPEDHAADDVERWVRYIVNVSHEHQPEAPVLLIEVTPTEKRFAVWPQIRQINARLREVALSTENTYFIATAAHFLDPKCNPRVELFGDDRLHLNSDGYDLWSELIRRRLGEVLRMTAQFQACTPAVAESASE